MPQQYCSICHDFGYVQIYRHAMVIRAYCICAAGDRRLEEIKRTMRESGLDPDDQKYTFHRYTPSYK